MKLADSIANFFDRGRSHQLGAPPPRLVDHRTAPPLGGNGFAFRSKTDGELERELVEQIRSSFNPQETTDMTTMSARDVAMIRERVFADKDNEFADGGFEGAFAQAIAKEFNKRWALRAQVEPPPAKKAEAAPKKARKPRGPNKAKAAPAASKPTTPPVAPKPATIGDVVRGLGSGATYEAQDPSEARP